ncbi:MAG: hypothetical protein M3Y28_01390 [Armatimonadota bacterium]|nr:hypothetical protein [Armatimonadota bacterium]
MSVSLMSLPREMHHQLVEDFQDAAASQDVAHLDSTLLGWLTTAGLYARPDLAPALEHSEGIRIVHTRLVSLLAGAEEDEDEPHDKPTAYAYNTALQLLIETQSYLPAFPKAAVTADETGGVRIQWTWPERQVRLIVPCDNTGRYYLYHESGDDYDVQEKPSPADLAHWLS